MSSSKIIHARYRLTHTMLVAGFVRSWDTLRRHGVDVYVHGYEGEIDAFSRIDFGHIAERLEEAAATLSGDWVGVFAYDVSEALGEWLATRLASGPIDSRTGWDDLTEQEAHALCRECHGGRRITSYVIEAA